jgi:hypothetical protein
MDGLARDGALRELKGPALAVLVAVGRHGRATHAQLSAETGWGRNTTYEALRRLVGAGWLAADGRGWWLLTAEREDVWDGLWGGGRGPVGDASAAAPGDGPAGETAVPANGTVIHRQAEKVTGNGTKAVPRNGTKRGKGVPGKGTKRRKRVPGSGTAQEVVPGNGTAPHHDDHVDHDAVDDHQSATTTSFSVWRRLTTRSTARPSGRRSKTNICSCAGWNSWSRRRRRGTTGSPARRRLCGRE